MLTLVTVAHLLPIVSFVCFHCNLVFGGESISCGFVMQVSSNCDFSLVYLCSFSKQHIRTLAKLQHTLVKIRNKIILCHIREVNSVAEQVESAQKRQDEQTRGSVMIEKGGGEGGGTEMYMMHCILLGIFMQNATYFHFNEVLQQNSYLFMQQPVMLWIRVHNYWETLLFVVDSIN